MTKDEALKLAQKAMGLIGADLVCEAAHHEKKDRHQIGEPCPIQARWHQAFAAIKEVLAQHDSVQAKPEPEQEPVAVVNGVYANRIEWKCTPKFFPADGTNLYTTSPQRTWVGLTEKEQDAVFKTFSRSEAHKLNFLNRVASAIEAKLKEKNNA